MMVPLRPATAGRVGAAGRDRGILPCLPAAAVRPPRRQLLPRGDARVLGAAAQFAAGHRARLLYGFLLNPAQTHYLTAARKGLGAITCTSPSASGCASSASCGTRPPCRAPGEGDALAGAGGATLPPRFFVDAMRQDEEAAAARSRGVSTYRRRGAPWARRPAIRRGAARRRSVAGYPLRADAAERRHARCAAASAPRPPRPRSPAAGSSVDGLAPPPAQAAPAQPQEQPGAAAAATH